MRRDHVRLWKVEIQKLADDWPAHRRGFTFNAARRRYRRAHDYGRNTKFFKTRLVPIGPKLTQELASHLKRRRQLRLPAGEDSPLFTTRTGKAWPYQHVITLFQRVRRAAGIDCPAGELRPPRLHDLRHTAAVHRVLAWYRAGKDVQRLLPQLATYLGHVDIKSTRRYLRMTPELLHEASQRFAHYVQCEGSHD
jgi:integrase/recombinase XerD